MNCQQLLVLLQSEDVYDQIKQNEDAVFELIPELKVCKGFDQKNSWHIYDVYEHILHVVDGVQAHPLLRLVALFHDIGKPQAFTLDDSGVGHFYGHWDRSLEIFQKYASRFGLSTSEKALADALIFYHDVNVDKMEEAQVEEMVEKIGSENIGMLFDIKRADLLAQSDAYHGLLDNIKNQGQRIRGKA